jgi:hypothetical protein
MGDLGLRKPYECVEKLGGWKRIAAGREFASSGRDAFSRLTSSETSPFFASLN